MATSLIGIASDLADQYPNMSTQDIIEIIIDSIESESVISDAISYVTIPTPLEIKHANLRSQRFPKEQARIAKHIDNAHFFRKLKGLYMLPLLDTGTKPIIEFDGACVDVPSSAPRPSTTYEGFYTSRPTTLNGTQLSTAYNSKDSPATHSRNKAAQDSPARVNREVKVLSSDILKDIETNLDNGAFLSFYDIYQIVNVMKLYPSENSTLNKISQMVGNDINHRNKAFKSNCLKELYRGDDQLAEDLRVLRPKTSSITDVLHESLKAIILNEYQRLHSQSGKQYIDGETSYDTYLQAVNKYTASADILFSYVQ